MAKPNGVKIMTALLSARPEKQEEFSQVLRGLRTQISAQPGCLDCVVGQDMALDGKYVLCSIWRDGKALEDHLASDQFRILRGAMNILSTPGDFRLVTADTTPSLP
jgi:quinol monooxygenase YgiN